MPVTAKKVGKKYRVVEAETGAIAKNKAGTAADGGGHATMMAATRQARAMNAHMSKKKKMM